MSHPRAGWLYESAIPGAQASHLLVLTEDDWNAVMADCVVVPIYAADLTATKVTVPVADGLIALCTRTQSVPHDFVGAPVGACAEDPWVRVRIGVRAFLDIDRRASKQPSVPPTQPRQDWWPRQHDIHFAANPHIGPDDKLYAVVADNDWNAAPGSRYTAAVRLTSRTKAGRRRWEVPIAGSWGVTGDLYSVAYSRFEQGAPREPYPQRVSGEEGAVLAVRQKTALSLL